MKKKVSLAKRLKLARLARAAQKRIADRGESLGMGNSKMPRCTQR